MESQPRSGARSEAHNKKTKLENSDSCKYFNIGINLVMCIMCVVSVSSALWREFDLNSRLSLLEDRVAYLEVKSLQNVDNLVERFRREAVYHLKRRVTRDLVGLRQQPVMDDAMRTTRDAPECICPAGE